MGNAVVEWRALELAVAQVDDRLDRGDCLAQGQHGGGVELHC